MEKIEFNEKLMQYKDTVFRVALAYLKNRADAEDVCQETFLKFYLRDEPFSDESFEKAWLIRVTLNACHNLHRSYWNRNRADMPDELAIPFEDPSDHLLYEAVFALPDKYRVVILLYYYEEYSVREISELLGRTPSTIQTQLSRARKKLYDLLSEETKGGFRDGQAALSKGHGTGADVVRLYAKNPTSRRKPD